MKARSSNPKPADAKRITLTVNEMAEMLQITPRRLQKLVEIGAIQRDSRGRYNLAATVRGYVGFLRKSAGVGDGEAGSSPATDKARLLRYRADIAQFEAERLAGQLVPVSDVEKTWTDLATVIRARLLALPHRLSSLISVAASIPEIHAILDAAIRETLVELSEIPISSAPDTETGDSADTEEETA